MPPRKRRTRRKVDAPAQEPVPAQGAAEPVSTPEDAGKLPAQRTPALTRATQEVTVLGYVVSRRPGDHWRERLMCTWRPAGACPTCTRPRFVLVSLSGEAAVCDLLEEVLQFAERRACTCSYAMLEKPHAAH